MRMSHYLGVLYEAGTYRLKSGIQNNMAGTSTKPERKKLTYLLPARVPLLSERP